MTSDLDDLEATADRCRFAADKCQDRRRMNGNGRRILPPEKTEYLRKFGKGLTRRKTIPITLAGPKS